MKAITSLDEAIRQSQKGRAEGFTWLLKDYGPRLYSYFYRLTGNGHDAEDLVQELFARLLSAMKDYQEQGRFESWLFRMALNLYRDYRRHQQQNKEQSTDPASEGYQNRPVSRPGQPIKQDPAETMIQREQWDQLQQALARLDSEQREMILMRHFGDMSFNEIAETFDVPIGTALSKIHRGMRAMKLAMKNYAKAK